MGRLKRLFQPLNRLFESLRQAATTFLSTLSSSEDPLAQELPLDRFETQTSVERIREKLLTDGSVSSGQAVDNAPCSRKTAIKYLETMATVYDDVVVYDTKGVRIWVYEPRAKQSAGTIERIARAGWRGPILIASSFLFLYSCVCISFSLFSRTTIGVGELILTTSQWLFILSLLSLTVSGILYLRNPPDPDSPSARD